MTEPRNTSEEAKAARDGRAIAVAQMLRSGWTGRAVSEGLKIIDAGGGVMLAMSVMREAQKADVALLGHFERGSE